MWDRSQRLSRRVLSGASDPPQVPPCQGRVALPEAVTFEHVFGYGRRVPSRPLGRDRTVIVKLHTALDAAAIAITNGEADMPVAVAQLAQLVPPARVDLVDEVLVRVGRRDLRFTLDWPLIHLVHQLAFRVKRVQLGEVAMRGPNGIRVEVVRYIDKMQQDRRVYRLTRHRVFVGEYKTPDDLAKMVDLAELIEDES